MISLRAKIYKSKSSMLLRGCLTRFVRPFVLSTSHRRHWTTSMAMSPTLVDTIIDAAWILPIAPDETTALKDNSIVIQNGKIQDVLLTCDVDIKYSAHTRLDRTSCVVLPGFINAHAHTGMTLMRGRADDMALLTWLRKSIWPMEAVFSSQPEFCYDGALLSCAEMVRAGITCFADMYYYPDMSAEAALESGMRAIIGMVTIGFPSKYAQTPDEYLQRGHEAQRKYAHEPTLTFAYAPHAPYTVMPEQWTRLRDLSAEHDVRVHTHLHETHDECVASLAQDRDNPACHTSSEKCHPIANLDRVGLLNDRLVAVHMVHLTDDEVDLCARRGVHVVSCPTSNAKLASGFCRLDKLLRAGVNVALGTDSACSNNVLDIQAEMKMAALQAKNLAQDASFLSAATALKMATINGACAFGIDGHTGSLEVGKAADVVCIDVATHAGNSPVFNPHSAVVYASSRHDVRDVLVNGRFLLRDRKHCTLDLEGVLKKSKYWQEKILEQFPM